MNNRLMISETRRQERRRKYLEGIKSQQNKNFSTAEIIPAPNTEEIDEQTETKISNKTEETKPKRKGKAN